MKVRVLVEVDVDEEAYVSDFTDCTYTDEPGKVPVERDIATMILYNLGTATEGSRYYQDYEVFLVPAEPLTLRLLPSGA